ncbi:probable CoA ligase CCL10 [Vicia villosa]|uniref:probable CoA ligase CCL10 n=1 Tax=Vicia villosa TaxID=3911 RepID=UPI00273B80EF|nr:probable CoA ligase CCL10 [Vicia villosa]
MAKNCFDLKTMTYTSPRQPIHLPTDPNLSLTTFLFQSISSVIDTIALSDAQTGDSLTFRQLETQVTALSRALLRLGIQRGDVVLLFAPNSIRFPVCFLAIVSIGAIATTCSPLYTVSELSNQIQDSNPKLVFTVSELLNKIEQLPLSIPSILLDDASTRVLSSKIFSSLVWDYNDLTGESNNLPDEIHANGIISQSDVAVVLYSSGTTGRSKGVMLTHRNFIATALMGAADQDYYGEGKNVALCLVPMHHVLGLAVIMYTHLRRGNTVVSMVRFELEKTLAVIEKFKVTHLSIAPPVLVELVKRRQVVSRYDLSSLKKLACGAAPLGKDVFQECAKILPQAKIVQGYGMTESCGLVSVENSREEWFLSGSGSSGALLPSVESRIVSLETSETLPPNQVGEIWLRGPTVMKGYFKNLEATKNMIIDEGWMITGDLGYFDEKGQLFVVDRIKELIKCNGYQVAPAQLEDLLVTHPEISDAGVIPSPDANAGEVPVAFVVRSPNNSITEEDIKKFVAQQVAPYKRLRRVTFIEKIPKSTTGKILRKNLVILDRQKASKL